MNVELSKKYTFYANVYTGTMLLPTSFDVTVNFMVISEDPEEYSIAFERVNHFIHNVCYGSIFFYDQDEDGIPDNLGELGNYAMGLPEPPCAQTIGMMLFCKLDAIMEDAVEVGYVTVSSAIENKIDNSVIEFSHHRFESFGNFEEDGWWDEAEIRTRDGSGFESWDDIAGLWRSQLSWKMDDIMHQKSNCSDSKKEKTEGDVVFVNFSSKKEKDDEDPQ